MLGSLSNFLDWDKRVLRVRSVLVSSDFYFSSRYHILRCTPSTWTMMTLRS